MTRIQKILPFLVGLTLLFACETAMKKEIEAKSIDLKEIQKKGKLTILTENSSLSFFEYRDKNLGFEYEILEAFAKHLGITLEIKVVPKYSNLRRFLNNGEGDIIAANLAITLSGQKKINFSHPYYYSNQVLVQMKSDSLVLDASELIGKEVMVRKNTIYDLRLRSLQEEIGGYIKIQYAKEDLIVEDLIEKVLKGEIKYTIAHENLARLSKEEHPKLDIKTKVSFKQRIAFGLRLNSPELKKKLDEFLEKYCESEEYNALKHKYFDFIPEETGEVVKLGRGKISQYDKFFKQAAKSAGWDWKFLAAIAYKESQFNPYAKGARGAFGIMQFMPNTGNDFGVNPMSSPEVQITAGMKLINRIYQTWSSIPDKEQRYKFTLASYNAGPCHIFDAQALAKEKGLNPELWDGNVALMVEKLSDPDYYRRPEVKCGAYRGHAVKYVEAVIRIYNSWK
jgi:membrane-bound lytic murein transglycosylase F